MKVIPSVSTTRSTHSQPSALAGKPRDGSVRQRKGVPVVVKRLHGSSIFLVAPSLLM